MYGRPHFEVSDGYGAGDAAYGMNRGLGMGAGAPGAGINPSMLNSAGSGMGFTDEELLESLMSDSNGGMGSVPMHQQSSVGNDQTMGVSQPLRSLPRHLDTSSPFAFNSPVSPSDIYSPGSASTSAADSFFRDREGSFSAGDEVPLPGVPGKDGASFDRSRSGKVPSSRARAGRRSSTSMSRTDSLQPPGSIPAGSLTGYASIGYQSTSRPQAASVPTYLSTMSHHLGSPNGWTSSSPMGQHAPSFDPSMLQGGFYPGLANGSQIGAASADSGARNGVSRDIHRLKNGFAPSSAPVSRTAIARLPDASPAGESDDPQKTAVLTEKKRRRRESHNAVERRRRDNINERISELATLLPDFMLEGLPRGSILPVAEEAGDDEGDDAAARAISPQAAAAAAKPNKGVILSKSVEYIRHLQSLVELQAQRNTELETILRSGGARDLSSSTATIIQQNGSMQGFPDTMPSRNGLSPSNMHSSFKREPVTPLFDDMEE